MQAVPSRKNGAGHVYAEIKHLLVNYHFRPAKQLHPSDLAERLKVSSTPVREALQRLAGEHLLVSIPSHGFFSKILSADEMRELSVLTCVLLQHAIRTNALVRNRDQLAARHVDMDGIEAELAEDPVASYPASLERLFNSIALWSDNRSLVSFVSNLNDRTHYVRLLDLESPGRKQAMADNVRFFIEALRNRNVPDAVTNLQEQLTQALALIPELVKEGLARCYAVPTPDDLVERLRAS
jgi:DNA-binding GntR family transcriptional regulator